MSHASEIPFATASQELKTFLQRAEVGALLPDVEWGIAYEISVSFEITGSRSILLNPRIMCDTRFTIVSIRHAIELAWLLQSGVDPALAGMSAARIAALIAEMEGWPGDASSSWQLPGPFSAQSPPDAADLEQAWAEISAHQPQARDQLSSVVCESLIRCWSMLAPVEMLMERGGDVRLEVDPLTGLNGYGCSHRPRPWAITFASTTASSVSERGYASAEAGRRRLTTAALGGRGETALADEAAAIRRQIAEYYMLPEETEVILAASGTDCELIALAIAQAAAGSKPLTNVLIAPQESGSGVPFAATGRHFAIDTARGVLVDKGTAIAGFGPDVELAVVPLAETDGSMRQRNAIDDDCERIVAGAVGGGRHAILHRLDVSKLGRAAPSCHRIRAICRRFPDHVDTVVDACQARLSRETIADYIDAGWMVLITGSKFFTGPPFSGAVLLPASMARRLNGDILPSGLRDYTGAAEWPARLGGSFSGHGNYGLILRWLAALGEMHAFASVPPAHRKAILERFNVCVRRMISDNPDLVYLPVPPLDRPETGNDWDAVQSIFSFAVVGPVTQARRTILDPAKARQVYQWLNADLTQALPHVPPADRIVAARRCHIGQPVAVPMPDGQIAGALRIAAGARLVSGEPSHAALDENDRIQREIEDVHTVLKKISLIIREYNRLEATNPQPSYL